MYLDGELLGRGPERGDAENWFYETYDLLVSRVNICWLPGSGR